MEASVRINSSSNGFANRASATVVESPALSNVSAANLHSSKRVPKDKSAILLPSLTIRPLPIFKISPRSGSSTPTPSPRGYLKAIGPSS